ncbi:MAG: hypothetical protein AAGC67_20920, partial [Myxococcota bacterium]
EVASARREAPPFGRDLRVQRTKLGCDSEGRSRREVPKSLKSQRTLEQRPHARMNDRVADLAQRDACDRLLALDVAVEDSVELESGVQERELGVDQVTLCVGLLALPSVDFAHLARPDPPPRRREVEVGSGHAEVVALDARRGARDQHVDESDRRGLHHVLADLFSRRLQRALRVLGCRELPYCLFVEDQLLKRNARRDTPFGVSGERAIIIDPTGTGLEGSLGKQRRERQDHVLSTGRDDPCLRAKIEIALDRCFDRRPKRELARGLGSGEDVSHQNRARDGVIARRDADPLRGLHVQHELPSLLVEDRPAGEATAQRNRLHLECDSTPESKFIVCGFIGSQQATFDISNPAECEAWKALSREIFGESPDVVVGESREGTGDNGVDLTRNQPDYVVQ